MKSFPYFSLVLSLLLTFIQQSSQRPHGYGRIDLLRNKIVTLRELYDASNETVKREGKSYDTDIYKNMMKKTVDAYIKTDEEYLDEDQLIDIFF